MRRPLTKRQSQILSLVRTGINVHGYAPTLNEIGMALGGLNRATIHEQISVLVAAGLLRKNALISRGLSLPDCCPCCGTVIRFDGEDRRVRA